MKQNAFFIIFNGLSVVKKLYQTQTWTFKAFNLAEKMLKPAKNIVHKVADLYSFWSWVNWFNFLLHHHNTSITLTDRLQILLLTLKEFKQID